MIIDGIIGYLWCIINNIKYTYKFLAEKGGDRFDNAVYGINGMYSLVERVIYDIKFMILEFGLSVYSIKHSMNTIPRHHQRAPFSRV